MFYDSFFEKLAERLHTLHTTQAEAIEKVARLIVATMNARRKTFVFGSGHSNIVAQETSFRTGSLPVYNPIFVAGLLTTDYPYLRSGLMERISGIAAAALEFAPVKEGDVLIVISNSGRNNACIEMALEGRQRGLHVIGITNVEFSTGVDSRHPNGKRLYEVVDTVVDNCCPAGDAAIEVPGTPAKLGPLSTLLGIAALHAISCRVCDLLVEQDIVPPIYISGNVDGSDEHNFRLFREYKDLITYM